MQRRVGELTIESIASQSTKFAAPVILIHGMWCSAAVWRRFMGYLAHRGWSSHAVNLRGHGDAGDRARLAEITLADHTGDLEQVIAACETAPVVIGHDLGAFLALGLAPQTTTAVVALAPMIPRTLRDTTNPALSAWRARLAMYRARPLPPPYGRLAHGYFGSGVPGGTTLESARVARELCSEALTLPVRARPPTLLVAGERDTFSPPSAVQRLAAHLGVQVRTVEGAGHAMPWEDGWEGCVSLIHRWLIQSLGEPLLLLHDEQDE